MANRYTGSPGRTGISFLTLTPQSLADLQRLVATGLFGLTVADCAARFIDQAIQQKAVEGWLPMPRFAEPKRRGR